MALYDRLLGRDEAGAPVSGKIPVHQFQAVMAERARGVLASNAAARDVINGMLADPLSASEEQEAVALLNTISGAVTAKLARAKEIDDVLLLGERGASGYALPSQVKARLGV